MAGKSLQGGWEPLGKSSSCQGPRVTRMLVDDASGKTRGNYESLTYLNAINIWRFPRGVSLKMLGE